MRSRLNEINLCLFLVYARPNQIYEFIREFTLKNSQLTIGKIQVFARLDQDLDLGSMLLIC